MRLTDILKENSVKVPLTSTNKQDAIYELIDLLGEANRITDVDELRRTVWERECTRSTGIGEGLAIPHGRSNTCQELVMAFGKPAEPLEFDSIDKQPVRAIFLLASPQSQTGPHIQALARVSRLMLNKDVQSAIFDADSSDEVYKLIAEQELAAETASV